MKEGILSALEKSKIGGGTQKSRLTARGITSLTTPGYYSDPDNKCLYLQVSPTSKGISRSWIFRYTSPVTLKRREMGLGSTDICSLANARLKVLDLRKAIYEGIDPIEERQAKKTSIRESHQHSITFAAAAERCIQTKKAEWSNTKHQDQWTSTMAKFVSPLIGKLRVDQINTSHIVKVLEQTIKNKKGEIEGSFWNVRTETATRVRQRIEVILDWCRAHEYTQGENPARYQGALSHLLPKASKIKKSVHHPALPFQKIGEFMSELRSHSGYSALALELLILTATRTSEIIEAKWDEFNLDSKVWTIPAERMKAGKEHRIPLNTRAMEILEHLKTIRVNSYLFPSTLHKEGCLSNMALLSMMRKMGKYSDYVPHGFRSTFRDWAAETTDYSNETVELALAHTIKNKAEAAYRRQDQLEKRSALMSDWLMFIQG
ncbi:integrase [Polynucleobacter sphagniphilus]|uniref:Integrase n=1 Tax=Polynucleobacter sphagniphilus TaxID=1743169 RepID=A0AA43S6Q1_9BURK|nr:site-specific integrase [Polynucleobacter sphagniphilus]MDH6504747.1 integrase [Polynucleobacter sphagniphilus]MDH6512967.1 integrase [Polynucleobacter sphagniphilus]